MIRQYQESTTCGQMYELSVSSYRTSDHSLQESRAVAGEPRNAAAVVFGLKFADNNHYKFKSSQASKARLQSSKRIGAKQNLMQNGHSMSRFGVSGKAIIILSNTKY